ncbi:MAG: AraC family transcriptional regulator [Francisellaceae bacterium]|nr:AraC family transcriptional regulator [Francisellaceae bacterium]
MLSNLLNELNTLFSNTQLYLYNWLACIGILWVLNFLNWMMGSKFNNLGIYPRHLFGLIGIFFSPLLHQNFNHLFFNSIPLFALGLLLLGIDPFIFYWVNFVVILIGGFLVWLLGRPALHIGASGLISGYFSYLLITAYLRPTITSILLALITFYYFGSILLGIIPREEKISWESHLYGFLAGLIAAYLLLPYFKQFKHLLLS